MDRIYVAYRKENEGRKGDSSVSNTLVPRRFSIFNRLNKSQLVTLKVDSILVPVYCHLGDSRSGCGDGGWTPVMKIDGSKVGLLKIKTLLLHIHKKILHQHFKIFFV